MNNWFINMNHSIVWVSKQFNVEKIIFSTNGDGMTGYPYTIV